MTSVSNGGIIFSLFFFGLPLALLVLDFGERWNKSNPEERRETRVFLGLGPLRTVDEVLTLCVGLRGEAFFGDLEGGRCSAMALTDGSRWRFSEELSMGVGGSSESIV